MGSYQFFAEIIGKKADFVIRCKRKTFERYHKLFSDTQACERVVELRIPHTLVDDETIPKRLAVRFISIVLGDGEVEVLATSLLDTKRYRYRDFKRLYYQRWRIETYFHTLKSRLSIDNFTGKTVEAIYQDFYSTIFLSGLESVVTLEATEQLRSRDTKNSLQVNKAVSFHVLKTQALELLFEQPPDFSRTNHEALLAESNFCST
jgi:IS4 transposase